MEVPTCALCDGPLRAIDRITLLGMERLIFHTPCYEDAVDRLAAGSPRPRTLDELRLAFHRVRNA